MNEILNAVNKALSVPIKIYYNKFSGEIIGSCPHDHEIDIDAQSIIVARTVAEDIFKNISEYIVAFDKDTNTIQPTKKSEVIKLLKPESKLFEIKKVDDIIENVDIAITIYKDDSILTLSLNPAIINRTSMPLLMSQLQFEEGSALNLFITKKNNPNAMLKSIYVDLNDFLSESKNIKTLEYYISDILQNISVDEISIYTRRIFEHYTWQIKDKFITTHKNKGISKRLLGVLESENYHLVITVEASNIFSVRLINDIDSEKYPKSEFIAFLREAKNLYSMSSSVNIELTKLKKNIPFEIRTNAFIDQTKALSWRNKNLNIKFIPYANSYN